MKPVTPNEPSLRALLFTSLSGLLLGIMLAVYILVTEPVSVVSRPPDEATLAKPGNYQTHWISGRLAPSESSNLRSARGKAMRRTRGVVSLSEDEANLFLTQLRPLPPLPAEQGGPEEPEPERVRMGPLSLRLVGDRIYGDFKLVMDPNGSPFELHLTGELIFENLEAGPRLQLADVRANSLPVPTFGGFLAGFVSSQVAKTAWPENVVAMWENIRSIEIESDQILADIGLPRS